MSDSVNSAAESEKVRFLVDFGTLGAGGQKLVIAAPCTASVAQLRELAEQRARVKWGEHLMPLRGAAAVAAASCGDPQIIELTAAGGYSLDDDEVALTSECAHARQSRRVGGCSAR